MKGKTEQPPPACIDWTGQPWTPDCGRLAAHPNSRFTAPMANNPVLDPSVDDPELSCRILRPQEMPRYIADGSLDAGITGSDWVIENNVQLVEVDKFTYARASLSPDPWQY